MSSKLNRKRELLEGERRYTKLLLTKQFKKTLEKQRKTLEEKIYHLKYIAQDCRDWKTSDLESIKRGMEISALRYRLAKELGDEARTVLDDMLNDVYPFLSDPRGLEEKVWEVFDDDETFECDESERNEALLKLNVAGFRLPRLPSLEVENPVDRRNSSEEEVNQLLMKETEMVNQNTEYLLQVLEEKKIQLARLTSLNEEDARTSTERR